MAGSGRRLVEYPTESREPLSQSNQEYNRLENWIRESLPKVTITKMERIVNSFMTATYELKKAEYLAKQKSVKELQVLHATAEHRVIPICRDNFDWRLVFRAMFGKGTSFSTSADYANCHCNRRNGFRRAFIATKMLVGDEEEGVQQQTIPFRSSDTTTNHNGLVYVKYQDNEFLPQFVVYYECPDSMISGSKYYRNWWR